MKQKSFLKNLAQLLREASDEDMKSSHEDGEDSVDAQIDHYLIEYESEAKSKQNEGLDWRRITRRIVEAGKGEEKNVQHKKLSEDDIEIESFVESVVRLIENSESLLELRNTILRRAANFLDKNYEPEVVEQYKNLLRDSYDVEIGKSAKDTEEEFSAPAADRAGVNLGGGGA